MASTSHRWTISSQPVAENFWHSSYEYYTTDIYQAPSRPDLIKRCWEVEKSKVSSNIRTFIVLQINEETGVVFVSYLGVAISLEHMFGSAFVSLWTIITSWKYVYLTPNYLMHRRLCIKQVRHILILPPESFAIWKGWLHRKSDEVILIKKTISEWIYKHRIKCLCH